MPEEEAGKQQPATGERPWSERLRSMQQQSAKAFQELDPGDIEAAVELGSDICKELGICCTEKGRVMFQVFKRLREQKAKDEALPLPEQPAALKQPTEKSEEGGEESA